MNLSIGIGRKMGGKGTETEKPTGPQDKDFSNQWLRPENLESFAH